LPRVTCALLGLGLCHLVACMNLFTATDPSAVRIAYGPAPSQFGELRLPATTNGPGNLRYPIAVLLHGGCWRTQYDLDYLRPLAQKLTRFGFVTWTLEYRRLGEPGGGWPGTLRDVATGMDRLRELSRRYPLDLQRIAVVGHSAGGQLALWLAGRSALTSDSELYQDHPVLPSAVIGLAPIVDMASFARGSGSCNAAVAELLGGSLWRYPKRYRDAGPPVAAGINVYLLHGMDDHIVPSEPSRLYIEARQRWGLQGLLQLEPGIDHFDIVDSEAPAWAIFADVLQQWLTGTFKQDGDDSEQVHRQ
jgi:acetyl esterase/lipase